MSHKPQVPLFIKIRILHDGLFAFGPGKAALLEAIAECRSIAAAGRNMGLSYTKTRRLLDELNHSFRGPLVESTKGGAGGGETQLTATARTLLAAFRAMEARAEAAVQEDLGTILAELREVAPCPGASR